MCKGFFALVLNTSDNFGANSAPKVSIIRSKCVGTVRFTIDKTFPQNIATDISLIHSLDTTNNFSFDQRIIDHGE